MKYGAVGSSRVEAEKTMWMFVLRKSGYGLKQRQWTHSAPKTKLVTGAYGREEVDRSGKETYRLGTASRRETWRCP